MTTQTPPRPPLPMHWHTERQDSGVLIIVDYDGKQWARLIRDAELENHYDRHFLFWIAILNLKYAAFGWRKDRRMLLDLAGIDQCLTM